MGNTPVLTWFHKSKTELRTYNMYNTIMIQYKLLKYFITEAGKDVTLGKPY